MKSNEIGTNTSPHPALLRLRELTLASPPRLRGKILKILLGGTLPLRRPKA